MSLREKIRNSGIFTKLTIGFILILLVGVVDYYTTSEISFSIFYLVPISFITWYTRRSYGIFFAVSGALMWLYMDKIDSHIYVNEAIPYWNTLVRFGFFIITVLLIWKVKELKVGLEDSVVQRTSDLVSEIELHKKAKEEIIQINDRLRDLNKKIENIKEEQNTRIAREIHDELGQSLTAINLELMWIRKKYSNSSDLVERMQMLSSLVADTINTVRKISSDLRPRLLDQLGIFPAIESQLKDYRNWTSTEIAFSYPKEDLKLDKSISITIFRIFQEALTNIARHADCTIIEIDFVLEADNILVMSIKDDGKGFSPEEEYRNSKNLGIIGMMERAHIINAALEVISAPGKGTEIILKTPI
ncbi:MAG: sensor histidine kinase [Ignavibacteria bacterium]